MKTICLFIAVLLFSSCNKAELERLEKVNAELSEKYQSQTARLKAAEQLEAKINFIKNNLKSVTASIVTDAGNIDLRFFPEKAPLTVYSFIVRAEAGYYNGTKFHRVMPNFMIQGGDANSKDNNVSDDGRGAPLAMQPHEFNDIKHVRGVLSTARNPNINLGAGSQFFIMHGEALYLDKQYTAFGEVRKGMDVVDKIATAKRRSKPLNYPVKPIVIKQIIVRR